jgi:hypothetical protein
MLDQAQGALLQGWQDERKWYPRMDAPMLDTGASRLVQEVSPLAQMTQASLGKAGLDAGD